MREIIAKLQKLQSEIHAPDEDREYREETLMFCEVGGLLKISFYGSAWDESFFNLLKLLSDRQVAEKISSLDFDALDEGANGTNNFDLSPLAFSNAFFPNLTRFSVKLTEPEDHNRTIVGMSNYEEGDVIAKLLNKMPALLKLQIPSAPSGEFFERPSHSLEHLKLQVGYDHQDFIFNLSNSTCFKNLSYFDFTDYQETYGEGWELECTPFADFVRLFRSAAFDPVRVMILRNLTYTDAQIQELKALRGKLAFRLVKTTSDYVY